MDQKIEDERRIRDGRETDPKPNRGWRHHINSASLPRARAVPQGDESLPLSIERWVSTPWRWRVRGIRRRVSLRSHPGAPPSTDELGGSFRSRTHDGGS